MWTMMTLAACVDPEDGRETDRVDTDVAVDGGPIVALPAHRTVPEMLAGHLMHQVLYDWEGELIATWTYAQIQAPSSMDLLDPAPEWCAAFTVPDAPGEAVWFGDDVGPSLELQVGSDTLRLLREEWDDQIEYVRDVDAHGRALPGTTPGAAVTFLVPSLLRVPEPIVIPGGPGFWADFFETGTLQVEWEPADSGFVELDGYVYLDDRLRLFYCVLFDDGSAVVDSGWTDLAGAAGTIRVARTNSEIVDVPDVGRVRLNVTTDVQVAFP